MGSARWHNKSEGPGKLGSFGLSSGLSRVQASLLAQVVKSLPALRETQVRSLVREDLLKKGMATHSSILA